jgi:hypothetical protein
MRDAKSHTMLGCGRQRQGWTTLGDIQNLIQALIHGQSVPLSAVLSLLAALVIAGILSGYVKEICFYFFPFPNQKSRIVALQRALIDEMKRADESRALTETAIAKSNAVAWNVILLRREVAARDAQLQERDAEIAHLRARIEMANKEGGQRGA